MNINLPSIAKLFNTDWRSIGTIAAFALPLLLSGCNGANGGPTEPETVVKNFDFNAGLQGWSADVSDLPANFSARDYELSTSIAPLPAPLDSSRRALRLTSFNHSDDLWQFIKRQIDGLEPDARYRVRFEVEIASDAPENSFGVGGSPGASVFLKAGASPVEPSVRVENGDRIFTLDKGNQANIGADARLLGNVGIPGDETVFRLKGLDNANQPFMVRTDNAGKVWVFVGTDSGYEGRKTLFYTAIKLTFTRQ